MSIATADNQWVNTDKISDPSTIERARSIIETNLYCALSTCTPDGFPWSSPVFFNYDGAWNLYWSSAITSQHSQNIYNNQGRASIAIYSTHFPEGSAQGVYLRGIAGEVEPENVDAALNLLLKRAKHTIQKRTAIDYLGDSPRRIYRFQPEDAWITGERLVVGNQLVDTKVQIDLGLEISSRHTSG